jgi:hypothetical protein
MGGSSGGGTTVQRQELDPAIRPYVTYGLEESQRLYREPGPGFFPGQTYVGPSEATQAAIQAAQNRAVTGSPLVPAAQAETLANIQGAYLGGNPFFQGAFQPAAQAAQQSFYDAVNQLRSQTAGAGRYGSGAMETLENRAMGQLGTSLSNVAGQLAYQNYDAERARQAAAVAGAPQMAQADFQDIQQLLSAGQLGESYQEAALQDAIQRYNYEQNLQQAKLEQYLAAAWGAPMGSVGTATQPTFRNQAANVFGGAVGGYAMGGPTGAALGGVLGGLL